MNFLARTIAPRHDCSDFIGAIAVDLYYFRVSLKPAAEPDAFEYADENGRPYTRETWLRAFFSKSRKFRHWSSDFEFLLVDQEAIKDLPHQLIFGWLARPLVLSERTPPDTGFEPTQRPSWRGALIIIDPTDHEDGQKILVEKRADVGDPSAILKSLARDMRIGDGPQPFSAQIFPIVEESSFWRFAEEHSFRITLLSFDVAVPNMFGGKTLFEEELKSLHKHNNVNRVKTTLVSDGVLDPKANNMSEIVDYTERGAGELKARAEDGARYSSRRFAKHDEVDANTEQPDFWARMSVWLQGRFP